MSLIKISKSNNQTIELNVIQEDIDKGQSGSWDNCPLTCAFKRQFPNKIGLVYLIVTPACLQFVKDFDKHGKNRVKPTKFVLEMTTHNVSYLQNAPRS